MLLTSLIFVEFVEEEGEKSSEMIINGMRKNKRINKRTTKTQKNARSVVR